MDLFPSKMFTTNFKIPLMRLVLPYFSLFTIIPASDMIQSSSSLWMDSLSLVVADLSSHTSQGKTTSSHGKRCLGKAQVVGWERDEATRKFNNKVNTRINMLLARKAILAFARVCVCVLRLFALSSCGWHRKPTFRVKIYWRECGARIFWCREFCFF